MLQGTVGQAVDKRRKKREKNKCVRSLRKDADHCALPLRPHARAPSLVLQSAPVLRNPPRFPGKTMVAWTSTCSPPTFHTLLCRSVPPPASAEETTCAFMGRGGTHSASQVTGGRGHHSLAGALLPRPVDLKEVF